MTQLQSPIVRILVGPIASGKSTYSRQFSKYGSIIINDDAIVNALHCDNYKLYDEHLKPLYKSVENTILQMALLLRRNVIIDRPNYSRAMRRRYIGIAKSMDAVVHVIKFPESALEAHAARRANSDGRGWGYDEWLKIAEAHKKQYEEPHIDEGIDRIITITEQEIMHMIKDMQD